MKNALLLSCIIIIAIVLRFYHLGTNPPALTWDEASWGYNAYALGIDGKDEFGQFLPYKYLESFGDFKPPMYAYLDILPIKILGLTPFATRFPSAFFGALTVLITYFLVKQIFYKSKYKEWYGLASALILAISPWHLMLSRAAFEANIATFFIVVGVWLFMYSLQQKQWLLPLSAISFVASLYTFNSARIVTPLLVIVLAIGFWKKLWQKKLVSIVACLVGIFLILPILGFLFSPEAKVRFQEVNIFSDLTVVETSNQEVLNDHSASWSKIIHNWRIMFGGDFLQHYLDNLSPNFLFIHGDSNPKFSIQDIGQMYIWDIPFFLAGLLLLFKKREWNWWFIPLWLFLGIMAAATARETPHALRTEATLPTFQILSAYGFVQMVSAFNRKFKTSLLRKSFITAICIVLFINVLYFQHDYYTHYQKTYSGEWQYGYEQSISYVSKHADKYEWIQVTQSLGRPYIYYLFFTKTDPKYFRQTAKITRDQFGFVSVDQFGKYHFVRNPHDVIPAGALYIDNPHDVPSSAHILQTYRLLNGRRILEVYTL